MGKSSTSGGWGGNFYISNAYAENGMLYEGSDERWKDFYEDIYIDFDELASIPKKFYSWKADEEKRRQIGVSAQKVLSVYPEIVTQDENGYYSVAYDRLAVIALAAIDKLHKENQELKEEIEAILSK